jgi:hypothetical protein
MPCKPYQLSLIFVVKALAAHPCHTGMLLTLPLNIRLR